MCCTLPLILVVLAPVALPIVVFVVEPDTPFVPMFIFLVVEVRVAPVPISIV